MRIFVENKFMVVPRKWGNQVNLCCWQSWAKRISNACGHPVLILLTKYREAWLWEHKFRNDIISSIRHIRTYHTACVCILVDAKQVCATDLQWTSTGPDVGALNASTASLSLRVDPVSRGTPATTQSLQSRSRNINITTFCDLGGSRKIALWGINIMHFCLQCLRITMYNTSNRTRWQKSYVIWGNITKWYIVHGAFTLLVKTLLCAYKMPIACHLKQ